MFYNVANFQIVKYGYKVGSDIMGGGMGVWHDEVCDFFCIRLWNVLKHLHECMVSVQK